MAYTSLDGEYNVRNYQQQKNIGSDHKNITFAFFFIYIKVYIVNEPFIIQIFNYMIADKKKHWFALLHALSIK